MIPRLVLAFVLLALDVYAFQAFRTTMGSLSFFPAVAAAYWVFSGVFVGIILLTLVLPRDRWPQAVMVYLPPLFLSAFIGKVVVAAFLLIDDLIRGVDYAIAGSDPERIVGMSWAGLLVAGVPFAMLVYGMLGNAYRYQVRNIKLNLPHLPDSFKGLKIVQLSDIHSGSLTRPDLVKEAVEMVNKLDPDLIFFTGDLVNMVASEIEPYVPVFSKLKAKYGVYSITGNHDYGDYVAWESPSHKEANFRHLQRMHAELGWRLLMNEHERILIGKDELAVIGIENWSAFGRFPKYGNLRKAYEGAEDAPLQLLLSHDPTHWKAEVLEEYPPDRRDVRRPHPWLPVRPGDR